jgi:hypothetical protein
MKSFVTVSQEELTQVDGGMLMVVGPIAGVAGCVALGWLLGAGARYTYNMFRG